MLKISVLSIGGKMPGWVDAGSAEYSKRLNEFCRLQWIELPLAKRNKGASIDALLEKEAETIKQHLPKSARYIALAIDGKSRTSEQLSKHLEQLQQIDSHLCLIIGGPDGLSSEILNLCHEKWSLSPLTLPHPLVRIIVLETLYRCFSIQFNHPYHK